MGFSRIYINIITILQVAFFSSLLLLSPCSVRNSIEDALNLERTTVINKSKSARVSTNACNTGIVELIVSENTPKKEVNFNSPLIASNFIAINQSFKPQSNTYRKHDSSLSEIPLYILYQNLKYHL